jgi:hypothetical protein
MDSLGYMNIHTKRLCTYQRASTTVLLLVLYQENAHLLSFRLSISVSASLSTQFAVAV